MSDFSLQISDWYRRNKRALPWRETNNPYFIWLSEIILQQTRVDQGMSYYLKFIQNYPTIKDLALADEQKVLNDWQGLGYYSRARNLHFTAKYILENYNGKFPKTHAEIINLKGIGEYTAAAISSFSYGLHHAVLDGNVFRVLSRIFDIETPIDSPQGKKEFSALAQELLPVKNSATHNQAIMEFGALFCTPKNPDCINCEISVNCLAFQNKTIEKRPVKIGKIKIRKRFLNYFVLKNSTEIIISKRIENDIWKHLYEFPMIESDQELNDEQIVELTQKKYKKTPLKIIATKKHILSHQHLFAKFIFLEIGDLKGIQLKKNEGLIQKSNIHDFPIPRMIDRFLLENEI